ncbi:MAG TPA: stalk domain-containing protein [Symbiobacteriaceae bacterium]|nr:stalk domain-containing protein [Symbiobacteriaceae bacterium]
MRKLTVFVAAFALALAFLGFAGTPALGAEMTAGPTVTVSAQTLGIKLEWSYENAAGAIGYVIRRGEASGKVDRWPVTDFPVAGNSWLDEEIIPGTTYYYVVVPVLKDGSPGFQSTEVAVTAVGLAPDRRLVHFHMDATEALFRTAAGDEMIALTGKPRTEHGRVLLTLEDMVQLTGADISRNGDGYVVHKLPDGRVMTMAVESPTMVFAKATRTDTCHPVMLDGHIYLPLRWIVEAMDGALSFNPLDGSVTFEAAR